MSHEFGATLPQIKRSWQEARAVAEELDQLGFHSAWVCDHVYGVPAPNLPIFEAWTQLAAVAAITQRVELGTLVTPPFFRNPAILAKQIATLDQISGGRAIAGIGRRLVRGRVQGHRQRVPAARRTHEGARGDGDHPPPAVERGARDVPRQTLPGVGLPSPSPSPRGARRS